MSKFNTLFKSAKKNPAGKIRTYALRIVFVLGLFLSLKSAVRWIFCALLAHIALSSLGLIKNQAYILRVNYFILYFILYLLGGAAYRLLYYGSRGRVSFDRLITCWPSRKAYASERYEYIRKITNQFVFTTLAFGVMLSYLLYC